MAETICLNCHIGSCDPRCPEAPEPKPIGRCCRCGGPVYPGERAYRADLDLLCEGCATPEEIAEMLNWDGWIIAGEE